MTDYVEIFTKNRAAYITAARRYLPSVEDAEDSVQESFMKIQRKVLLLNDISKVDRWMYRIVVNDAINIYRKNNGKNEIVVISFDSKLVEKVRSKESYDDSTRDSHKREMPTYSEVMDAIHSLSPAYEMIAMLFLVKGMSHAEISAECGISVGTSKSNLSKAKKNIRKYLKDKEL